MGSAPHHPTAISSTTVGDLLQRATDSVRRQTSREQTITELLVALERAIDVSRALVWEHHPDAGILTSIAGRAGGEDWNPTWQRSTSPAPIPDVLANGEFVAMTGSAMDELVQSPSSRGWSRPAHIVVGPITIDDQVWGVMSLSRVDPDYPFTAQELGMIRSIAGLMSVAVRTSLAMDAEREQRKVAQRIGAITAAFNHARTPEATARTLLRGVELLTGIQHAYVVLFNSTKHTEATVMLSRPLQFDERELKAGMKPAEHPIEREILRTGSPITGERFREMLRDPGLEPPHGVYGLAAIPVRDGPRIDGVLNLWTPHPPDAPEFQELSAPDLATIESLCEQTAVALERTRLQQLAQQTAQEQRVLGRIAERVSAASEPGEMAAAALDGIGGLVPARYARLTRCSGDVGRPTILGEHPEPTAEIDELRPHLALIERWVRDSEERWVGPLGRWLPPGSEAHPQVNTQLACLPITIETGTLGAMTVLGEDGASFTSHRLDLVEHACSQLGLGLQRASSHLEAIDARDEAKRHLTTIERMLRISNEMSRRHGLEDLVETMEVGLRTLIPHSAQALHRADERRGRLDLIHGTTIGEEQVVPAEIPFGDPVIGRVARLRKASQGDIGLHATLSAPMVIDGEVLGTITLWRDHEHPFDDQEASLLGIFAAHAGSELRRAEMASQRRELHLGGIRALVSTVDMRDPFTKGHSARVGRLSRLIAEEMRLPASEVEMIEVAGLLHDIGKIGIPDAILLKPGPLDDHERATMMGHADLGARILQEAQSPALEALAPLIRHHHEWWDGRGYPAGLRGDEIPIGAQIISVADAWDTMTNDRPYRQRMSIDDAWRILEESAGAQFAASVIDALGRLRHADDLAIARHIWQPPTSVDAPGPVALTRSEPLGDLRSLGILVDLARTTAHLTNTETLLREVTLLLAERLDVTIALVLDPDPETGTTPEILAHAQSGFTANRAFAPELLDRVLDNELPASLQSLADLPAAPAISRIFANWHNTGVVGLALDGLPRGALIFEPSQPDRYWRLDLPVVEAVAPHVLAVVNVARLHERARQDALTDGLTGAANYRSFYRTLAELLGSDAPFSLMMLDVIGLKQLNDTVGHLAGDELLRLTATLLRDEAPDADCIARIGGDEFGVIVRDVDPKALGDRILSAITARIAPMYAHTVSVRFGWASCPQDGATAAGLVHTADQRMYQSGPRRPRS